MMGKMFGFVLRPKHYPRTEEFQNDFDGKEVGYVEKGKDAAVSYGSLDLKFRNDLGSDIRIEATTNNETITIRLVQL